MGIHGLSLAPRMRPCWRSVTVRAIGWPTTPVWWRKRATGSGSCPNMAAVTVLPGAGAVAGVWLVMAGASDDDVRAAWSPRSFPGTS